MNDEVKQPTDEQSWDQVSKDRATATPAVEAPNTEIPSGRTAEADPLAGLPEPTRKLVEGLQAKTAEQEVRLRETNQKLSTAHGTMGSMRQQLEASRVALEKLTPTIEAVEAEKKARAKAEAETLSKARADHRMTAREKLGDFLDPEELDVLLPVDAEPAQREEPKTEPVKTEVVDPGQPDQLRVLELMVDLSDRAPGWRKTVDTPEFKAWLPAQNADIKAKFDSWDPDEAAAVFAAFEKHKSDAAQVAKVEKDRQDRLRRGETIQGRGTSNGNVDTSPDGLWEKVTRDREKSRASG